jgi:hypothetical protein
MGALETELRVALLTTPEEMEKLNEQRPEWKQSVGGRSSDLAVAPRARDRRAARRLPRHLPVAALREWLDQERTLAPDDALVDMTVVDAVERLGRSPSTVRGGVGQEHCPEPTAFEVANGESRRLLSGRSWTARLSRGASVGTRTWRRWNRWTSAPGVESEVKHPGCR